jgi:predicted transposase YdaD
MNIFLQPINIRMNKQETYQNSLKYYRDLNNVVDTSREEGRLEGLVQGREEGTRSLLIRQLSRQLGEIPDAARESIYQLSLEALEMLGDALFEFSNTDELIEWLNDRA